MPTTVWFSMLALLYVAAMTGYHGFYLVTEHLLPAPSDRSARGARSVLLELVLTVAVLGPVLRRVLPGLGRVRGPVTLAAVAGYLIVFAWLPLCKAIVCLGLPAGPRKDGALAALYSAPFTIVYVFGLGYLVLVTIAMMVAG